MARCGNSRAPRDNRRPRLEESRSRASVTCGVYLRPSGSSPMRCISRSCSACTSSNGCTGDTAATTARGLRPPNERQPFQMQLERAALDAAEHRGDLLGDHVVDVADEAQRQVIIFRIDPARARQSAAQHAERLPDVGGDFDTGEETRHGDFRFTMRALHAHGDQLLRPAAGYAPRSRRRRRRSDAGHRPD